MEVGASKQVPDSEEEDIEEAVPENRLMLDSLAEGCWLFKTAFDFFYHTDHSMIWYETKANRGRRIGVIFVIGLLLCRVQLFATPWTVAQASLSMEFSRQEYWSGLPFPSPGDLPDPVIELASPALASEV